MGNEEEEDETYFPLFKEMANALPKNFEEIVKELELLFKKSTEKKPTSEEEERNDVYIYKTLRYPPKSTPPTAS